MIRTAQQYFSSAMNGEWVERRVCVYNSRTLFHETLKPTVHIPDVTNNVKTRFISNFSQISLVFILEESKRRIFVSTSLNAFFIKFLPIVISSFLTRIDDTLIEDVHLRPNNPVTFEIMYEPNVQNLTNSRSHFLINSTTVIFIQFIILLTLFKRFENTYVT